MRRVRTALAAAAALALAAQVWSARAAAFPQSPPSAALPATRIEVVVVDRDGRPVDGLRPADFTVTVDGVARPVVSVRRVSRGPGAASDAALRQGSAAPGQSFASEPVRNVLVIIDQAPIVLGDEKTAVQASRAFLDRLGLEDKVAVVRLPFSADQRVELTTERPAAREALAQVRGQTARANLSRPDAAAIERPAVLDPDQAGAQPARQEAALPDMAVGLPDAELTHARNSLAAITGLLRSLRPLSGRKVVAVFSPGFQRRLDAGGRRCFGGRDRRRRHDLRVRPAVSPGRSAIPTGQRGAGDPGEKHRRHLRHARRQAGEAHRADDGRSAVGVRAEPGAGRRGSRRQAAPAEGADAAQGTSWCARLRGCCRRPTPGTSSRPLPRHQRRRRPATSVHPRRPRPLPVARAAAPSGKDADLPVALARLFDYVRAYESQYSALVAEEEFQQVAGQKSVRMRSDFLLVQQKSAGGWVSFRDVFEVNGAPVRDREDRLKKLFLDPGADAYRQVQSVVDESARYNIGPLERNINVPLFLLRFLSQANRSRSKFRIAARPEADGVQAWRIDFTEIDRPTIIRDRNDNDVPAKGSFLVEQSTGAIMESQLRIERHGVQRGDSGKVPSRSRPGHVGSGQDERGIPDGAQHHCSAPQARQGSRSRARRATRSSAASR